MTQPNHCLWDVVFAKSAKLQRPISYFKTKKGLVINLFIYYVNELGSEFRNACVCFSRRDSGLIINESYYLDPDGNCIVSVEVDITSTTGWASHHLNKVSSQCTKEEIFDESRPWLKSQLDKIAEWLNDPPTVRVDPYDYSKILPA